MVKREGTRQQVTYRLTYANDLTRVLRKVGCRTLRETAVDVKVELLSSAWWLRARRHARARAYLLLRWHIVASMCSSPVYTACSFSACINLYSSGVPHYRLLRLLDENQWFGKVVLYVKWLKQVVGSYKQFRQASLTASGWFLKRFITAALVLCDLCLSVSWDV